VELKDFAPLAVVNSPLDTDIAQSEYYYACSEILAAAQRISPNLSFIRVCLAGVQTTYSLRLESIIETRDNDAIHRCRFNVRVGSTNELRQNALQRFKARLLRNPLQLP